MPKKTLIFNETDDTGLYSFYFSDGSTIDTVDKDKAIEIVDNYLSVSTKEYYYTREIIINLVEIIKNCEQALNILKDNKDYLDSNYVRENEQHFIDEKHQSYLEMVNYLINLWADWNGIENLYRLLFIQSGDYDC